MVINLTSAYHDNLFLFIFLILSVTFYLLILLILRKTKKIRIRAAMVFLAVINMIFQDKRRFILSITKIVFFPLTFLIKSLPGLVKSAAISTGIVFILIFAGGLIKPLNYQLAQSWTVAIIRPFFESYALIPSNSTNLLLETVDKYRGDKVLTNVNKELGKVLK